MSSSRFGFTEHVIMTSSIQVRTLLSSSPLRDIEFMIHIVIIHVVLKRMEQTKETHYTLNSHPTTSSSVEKQPLDGFRGLGRFHRNLCLCFYFVLFICVFICTLCQLSCINAFSYYVLAISNISK